MSLVRLERVGAERERQLDPAGGARCSHVRVVATDPAFDQVDVPTLVALRRAGSRRRSASPNRGSRRARSGAAPVRRATRRRRRNSTPTGRSPSGRGAYGSDCRPSKRLLACPRCSTSCSAVATSSTEPAVRARRADVGIRDGRVVADGHDRRAAARTIDVDGLVIAPGFVDLHTHYDAQVLWDPMCTPSPLHGVTTVVGGNCGFTIAPLGDEADVDYVMRMMARVEGMSIDALRAGPAWDWRTFGEWLDRIDGRLGVNAGFLVGHSTMRRLVMGDAAVRDAATPEQIAAMVALAHDAMASGALGVSSSLGEAHTDGDGNPVPSRAASRDELLALAAAVRDHEGTTLEFIAAMGEIGADRIELMTDMSLAANRPLNWNLLGSLSPTEVYEQQLTSCDHATEHGAHVVALTLPDLMRLRAEPRARRPPGLARRRRARAATNDGARSPIPRRRETAAGGCRGSGAAWPRRDRAARAARDRRRARRVGADLVGSLDRRVAAERGADPDRRPDRRRAAGSPAAHDGLPVARAVARTIRRGLAGACRRVARRPHRARRLRRRRARRPHVPRELHRRCCSESRCATASCSRWKRPSTSSPTCPARLYGLRDRGRVADGWIADLVVFDPARIGSGPHAGRQDLPAAASVSTWRRRASGHVLRERPGDRRRRARSPATSRARCYGPAATPTPSPWPPRGESRGRP